MGHDAWTLQAAGRSGDNDTSQMIGAHDKNAVLVTHDAELSRSRGRMPIGRMIRLKGPSPAGPALLRKGIPSVVAVLEHNANIVVTVSLKADGDLNMSLRFGTERR